MPASNSPPTGDLPGPDREDRRAAILASGALVVILGLQLILPAGAPPADTPGLAARRQRPVTVPPPSEYPAILASPIFAPDRRPGPSGGLSDTGGGSLSGYAALGAAAGRTVATAVLSAPGGGVKTLRRGDEIEGWRLVGVDATRVTFQRDGVRHALVIGAPAESGAPPLPDAATPGMNP